MAYKGVRALTFHDAITSAGTGREWAVDQSAELLQIIFDTSGTFSATFQGSFDGTKWVTIGVMNCTTYYIVNQAADAAHCYEIDLDKWIYIRVNVTAITGTLTVKGYYGIIVDANK